MKTNFRFSNLLGTVYRSGNLVFSPNGEQLYSPVGNRVSCFDLVRNHFFTFPCETRRDIACIALSPQGTLLLCVDEEGRALLVNAVRRSVLHHFNFKDKVHSVAFSPDGQYIAVGMSRHVQVWRTPHDHQERVEFTPFVRHRVYTGHHDAVTHIAWSGDGRFFLTSSKDMTARIFSLDPEPGFQPTVLAGHKRAVVGAWFTSSQETIYTVSADGAVFEWAFQPLYKEGETIIGTDDTDPDRPWIWMIKERHYCNVANAKVQCCTFHTASNLLVIGFGNGIFSLYEVPTFSMLHSLSISNNAIDFVTVNKTGEWLAFGASKLGQLLVWEWQSESYILKQQGHFDSMTCLSYSADGQRVATGSEDGKIKIWDVHSGFCIVTFDQHTAAVTSLVHSRRGNVLFSSSLDGSVRAWDLVRYRNFRTFTAPTRVQFSCVAIDPGAEIVAAGSLEAYEIHLWSVQTGQLVDRLAGHDAPVSSLSFAPDSGTLASGSWDHSVRVWDVFGRSRSVEPLSTQTDVLAVAFRPDGKSVCVATLDGNLSFWDPLQGQQVSTIDGRRDIAGGRHNGDHVTAANSKANKHFTAVAFSADGKCVIAAGKSKYICVYDVATLRLVKKFTISQNLSLEGTRELLNSREMTEAGPLSLIDQEGEASDLEDRLDKSLPGASRGDMSKRKTRPEVRATDVKISPTGRAFSASTTEGLVVYSLDDDFLFDPFDLDIDVTPEAIENALVNDKQYLLALVMAFRLNERSLLHRVYESIPPGDIGLVAQALPVVYLARMLQFISSIADESPHVEFHTRWVTSLLTSHGKWIKAHTKEYAVELRALQRSMIHCNRDLVRLAQDNTHTLDFILSKQKQAMQPAGDDDDTKMVMA